MNRIVSVITLLFIIGISAFTQQKQYSFLPVTKADGMINNKIQCIHKDSRGFIWVGTLAGLSRYDGHSFVNFLHDSSDSTSLSNNYIVEIQDDNKGNLWIQTSLKPIVYDVEEERFYNDIGEYLGGDMLGFTAYRFYCDKNKQVWLRNYDQMYFQLYDEVNNQLIQKFPDKSTNGVKAFDLKHYNNAYYYLFEDGRIECYDDTSFELLFTDDFLVGKMGKDYLNSEIFVDAEGDIWYYGNHNGIAHFNARKKEWQQYSKEAGDIRLTSNTVHSIIQDEKGQIWIATDHGGLNILNKYSGKIEALYNQPDNNKSLSQNSIIDLYIDNNNIIWLGTTKNGLCYYHESIHKFAHYKHIVSDSNSLPFSDVNCFVEDSKQNLWIGTNGGGLIYYDRQNERYTRFQNDPDDNSSLSGDVIVSLFIDHNKQLWIGTYTAGLNRYDGKQFVRYKTTTGNGLTSNSIWSITADGNQRLWIGTLGGGVVTYDTISDSFHPLPNKGLIEWPYVFVNQVCNLSNGNMVIATANGIIFYNVEEERYKYHPSDNRMQPLGFGSRSAFDVLEDSRGLLWFASREGVIVYDELRDEIIQLTEKDGIAEDLVTSIEEDEFQSIWVSLPTGLCQIFVNRSSANGSYEFKVKHYTHADGLQSEGFNDRSSYRTSENELIFGGADGFNMFKVKDIKYNHILPQVVFTKLQVYNQSISPNSKVENIRLLKQSIVSTKEIVLKYWMNVFSIDFAALDFFIPQKTRYQYKLEGVDEQWHLLDEGLFSLTYANLKAGDYILKVKAANNDGVWNDKYAELRIKVLPPFYATPLAYALYFAAILLMIIYFRYSMIRKERSKFAIEQERLAAKRNHEMDEMKLRFLTNVSHEFRTPLTLILTPVQKLLEKACSPKDEKLLKVIDKNAKQLLNLVNQLLDFRKLELHGLRFNPSYGNLVSFIRDEADSFSESFDKKHIKFTFKHEMDELMLSFDKDKLQKVIMNLLSNALKFTPENGRVSMVLSMDEQVQKAKIEIKDTGVGIKKSDLEKVFIRFYQADNNKKLGLSGSGIGLNLARELVQLHNGSIGVESEEGKGAVFTILLPLDDGNNVAQKTKEKDAERHIIEEDATKPADKPSLLLVEDNMDFRTFMKETLEEDFVIREAADGQLGYNAVHEALPDIIISDVMMPNMDGLELCQKLRNDIRTSHIPIILLTARTADEDKIKGLEIGADDYITKPFNMDLLLLRVNKLLEKRSKMQQEFQKTVEINPSEVQITSMDEKLIKKAVKVVEDNMAEAGFSVEDLSNELAMSRVYLYKKLVSITGKSPIEFIRIIRLKRGAQLLEKSQMSIAEVAYEVGFNNPRYFSKYFKEEYGMLPTAYIKAHAKK
ncbi:response regulator [Carboxylicivirga sp. A043]|uniref:hybrid sensor histidine kinase/response regulator transcription factor n=1 Tax=Carboxylicivirga litoralis TaxID=2816963 RepID=UPI0021CAF590|nr:hybrid sensor histidine kinase/response regulator transcription factor [Carboxylicivirga sp. A043]MCU4157288.1 response regulator [Carboxylicivirga sp. A043]